MIPALGIMNSFSTYVHTWLESLPCLSYTRWIPLTGCFGLNFSISLTSRQGIIGGFENKQPNLSASIWKIKGKNSAKLLTVSNGQPWTSAYLKSF